MAEWLRELLSLAICVAIPVCARLFLSLEAATLFLLYVLEYAYSKDLPLCIDHMSAALPHFLQPIPRKSTSLRPLPISQLDYEFLSESSYEVCAGLSGETCKGCNDRPAPI